MSETKSVFDHVPVEKGMVLLHRDQPAYLDGDYRYDLWTVTSVRRSTKGASVKLLRWSEGAIIEATASFPNATVTAGWQVFSLSQSDFGHVWNAHRNRQEVVAHG